MSVYSIQYIDILITMEIIILFFSESPFIEIKSPSIVVERAKGTN